jgi:hypothetical protein
LTQLLITGRAEHYAAEWKRHFATRIRAASVFAHLAMQGTTRAASLAVIRRAPTILSWGARLSGKTPISA